MQKGVAGRGMLGRFLHEGTSQMPVRDARPSHSRVIDILLVAWRGRESFGVEDLYYDEQVLSSGEQAYNQSSAVTLA